jgi:hypothetical protein
LELPLQSLLLHPLLVGLATLEGAMGRPTTTTTTNASSSTFAATVTLKRIIQASVHRGVHGAKRLAESARGVAVIGTIVSGRLTVMGVAGRFLSPDADPDREAPYSILVRTRPGARSMCYLLL